MNSQILDKKSRAMLNYLNINSKLTSATLAEAFNQHYSSDLKEAIETLFYLESKSLVKIKIENDSYVVLIQITHLGHTYEQELEDWKEEEKKKVRCNRFWNILTLILSSVLTIIVNLILKRGFNI